MVLGGRIMKSKLFGMLAALTLLSGSSVAQAQVYFLIELSGLPFPTGINNAGQIVGNSTGGLGATVWDGGTATPLGTLTSNLNSKALGINDAGQIAGYSPLSNGTTQAVIWNAGVPTNLGATVPDTPSFPVGGVPSQGLGLNNIGQVVGLAQTPVGFQPALWSGGTTTILGNLGGPRVALRASTTADRSSE